MTHNSEWLQRGHGERTLVFLHYLGGAEESWQWVIDELEQDYSCVAVNLPGFGGARPLDHPSLNGLASAVRFLLEERLRVDRFTLIGHGMGGKVALQLAADDASEHIDHLILVAPSPPEPERSREVSASQRLGRLDPQEAEVYARHSSRLPLSAEQMATAVETQLEVDEHTLRWWLEEGCATSVAASLPRIRASVSVLAALHDPVVKLEELRAQLIDRMPHAVITVHPESGHLLPLEDPQWLAQRIRAIAR